MIKNNMNYIARNIRPDIILKSLIEPVLDYKKNKELEQTKRLEIIESSNIKIQQIRSFKEFFLEYLDKEYKERFMVYKDLFDLLDKGIENNNCQLIDGALSAIVQQIQKNPFESFEIFKKKFNDPKYIDEI